MGSHRLKAALALLALLCVASEARADAGELTLGPSVGVTAGRGAVRFPITLRTQLGLNDAWSVYGTGGLRLGGDTVGQGGLGLSVAFDVLRLVPELDLGVSLNGAGSGVRALGHVAGAVRWFLDPTWAVRVEAGLDGDLAGFSGGVGVGVVAGL